MRAGGVQLIKSPHSPIEPSKCVCVWGGDRIGSNGNFSQDDGSLVEVPRAETEGDVFQRVLNRIGIR